MADEKDKKNGEGKEFDVSGEMEGSATVHELKQKDDGGNGPTCTECGTRLFEGRCINSDCPVGQAHASVGASESTRKAAVASPPRAVTRSGRVD